MQKVRLARPSLDGLMETLVLVRGVALETLETPPYKAVTGAIGTGIPVQPHPVPIFGPAMPEGCLSASSDE